MLPVNTNLQQRSQPLFDPLCDWSANKHDLTLCELVRAVGPCRWDIVANSIHPGCPPALCALRWHALLVEHERGRESLGKATTKWYSDWELCVLYVACHTGVTQHHMSKASVYQVLATWLPGRTAAGLKQAAAQLPASCDGQLSPQVIETLQSNGWPSQLTALMAAWPGPPTSHGRSRTVEDDKAAAAEIIASLQQQQPQQQRDKAPPPAAASSSARGHSAGAAASTAPPAAVSPDISPPAAAGAPPSQGLAAAGTAPLTGDLTWLRAPGLKPALTLPALLPHSELGLDSTAMPHLSLAGRHYSRPGSAPPEGRLQEPSSLADKPLEHSSMSRNDTGLPTGASRLKLPQQQQLQPPAGRLQHALLPSSHSWPHEAGSQPGMMGSAPAQPSQHAQLVQSLPQQQQQQQQQQAAACYATGQLQHPAGLTAAARDAAAGTGPACVPWHSSGPPTVDFDLPEEDPALRHALEQQLDAALQAPAAVSMDCSFGMSAPEHEHEQQQQQQQQQQHGLSVAAASAGSAGVAAAAPAGAEGTKRQRMSSGHLPQQSAPASLALASHVDTLLQMPLQAQGSQLQGNPSSFAAGVGMHSTAVGSVTHGQSFRAAQQGDMLATGSRPFGGLGLTSAPDQTVQGVAGSSSAAWAAQVQPPPQQPQHAGAFLPLWAQYGSQQQAWQQQQQQQYLPTWEAYNFLLQRVQVLELQQLAMQAEIARLHARLGER